MQLYCLAIDVPGETKLQVVEALSAMVRIFPQLDPETLWSRDFATHFAAGMHSPRAALGRRRYVYDARDHVTFFEGTLVDPRQRFSGNDAADVDRAWEDILPAAEGQYVAIRASADSVDLITDPVGMEQVYFTRHAGGWLIANSVTLLLGVVGDRSIDWDAASFFLCQSWVGEDRTLREGVRVIPGGQRWTWRRGEAEPVRKQYFGLRLLADDRHAVDIDALAATLIAQVSALGKGWGRLECPITAGKDSRLLVALVLKAGADALYFSAGAPTTLDVMAGRAIAERLQLPHEVRPYTGGDLAAEWDATSRTLLEQADGMVSLWYLDNVLDQPPRVLDLTMQLWGIGGEIARGYWNHPKVILRAQAPLSYLEAKIATTHGGLVGRTAHTAAVAAVRRFASEAHANGFRPSEWPDVFEAAQSVPRGDGARGRNSRSTGDYFSPYCTRPWLLAAFALTPAERMTEPFHRELLRRLQPDLYSPPLATPWRPRHPVVNLVSMIAMSASWRIRRRLRPRPMPGPVHHHSMLELKLAELRNRCLDRGGSRLWDLVSRDRFEELTAPGSSARSRSRYVQGLYNAITLFEYEALLPRG